MFSDFFIKRPIFATVLAVLMVLAGLMTVFTMPVAQYPDITPPTVRVSASYPGADAKTVAQTIGIPIEQQVNGVEGMLYMSSSSADGSYSLTITFESGTDLDEAAVEAQNRISMISGTLPSVVEQEGISVNKEATNQVLFAVLQSDDPDRYDALYLTNYAQLHIIDPLSRVDGVGGVQAFGAGEYSMRVWLDPEKMRQKGVTPDDVAAAIRSQNMQVSGGSVGAPPKTGNSEFEYTLVSQGRLSSPEEFGNIVLRTDGTGLLRLRDVGRVELGSSSYSNVAKVNGQETAMIGVSQYPGANAIEVADGVIAELDRLSNYFPEGISYRIVQNSTDYVHSSLDNVFVTFALTSLIVMIVIMIFLQNWRAVMIPMLTIPVSLIATFAVMKIMGFSLNTLSLFGLVLAIAIVVDDAIVVVEDCSRLVDTGTLTATEAAMKAMRELTGPVVGEVLVLMSVFIPTAFVSGITGSLYKQFALTIAVSTAFSGFNALTLTPALCALFLVPRKPTRFFLFKGFNKGWNSVLQFYDRIVTFILGCPRMFMIVFCIIALVAFWGFSKMPTSYIPEEDMGYFMTSVELPTGASVERTGKVLDGLTENILKIDGVKDVMSISGFSFLGGNGSNVGILMVMLDPWKERGSKEGIEKIMAETDRVSRQFPEAYCFSVNPPAIPGLGMSSGLAMQLLDINSLGADQMAKAIEAIRKEAEKDPRIESVTSLYQAGVPQYDLKIDRDRVDMLGLDISQVYATLAAYMGGEYVNDFVDFGRVFQVRMQGDGSSRDLIGDVNKLSVRNAQGDMVPFSAFSKAVPSMGQSVVSRYNMYDTGALNATVAKGVSSSEGIKAMEEIVEKAVGNTYSYAWTGLAYQETQAGTTISFVFIFAVIMTLLVLAAQYESWTDPMAVIMSLPIVVLGTALGVLFMRQSISIYTQIGLILLLGMCAKNAILIVEYAMDFRKSGVPVRKAAHDAGVIRLRPIMMMALAFIFGVLPMMFATGAGANSRIELGTAVVFGMTMNALLGTTFVPLLWEVMQHFQERYLGPLAMKMRGLKKQKTAVPSSDSPATAARGQGDTPSGASAYDDTNLPSGI